MVEDEKASEAELLPRIMESLRISKLVARSLLLESRTLRLQRMEEVLKPRELNLVRCHLGIGQLEEQGMRRSRSWPSG